MYCVETDWWLLDLPEEWGAEQDEETIVIGDEDGVGELEITTLERRDAAGAEVDLEALAQDVISSGAAGRPVRVGEFSGFYFHYSEDGDAVREWLLAAGDVVLLVSYSCDEENRGLDDAVVDEILDTLELKTGA